MPRSRHGDCHGHGVFISSTSSEGKCKCVCHGPKKLEKNFIELDGSGARGVGVQVGVSKSGFNNEIFVISPFYVLLGILPRIEVESSYSVFSQLPCNRQIKYVTVCTVTVTVTEYLF